MEKVFAVALAFLNLLPVWISIVISDLDSIFCKNTRHAVAEWSGIAIAVLGVLTSLVIVHVAICQKKQERAGVIIPVRLTEKKALTIECMISNVLPLLAFDFCSGVGLLQFLIFVVALLVLTCRSNAFVGSAYLGFIGYRFYDCEYCREDCAVTRKTFLVSPRYLGGEDGAHLQCFGLNDEVEIVK